MSKKQDMPKFGPLQGMRVVFSAMEIAGPFSAQLFAEWGAEVIWIENVAYADTIRVQTNYCELSRRNLYALSLNVFADEGREAFLKLLETADVFIEASKGPAFARHGIPDELMWQHNPKLVIAHLSGFGQYGDDRYTNLAAYNTIAQAFSGYLIQNGDKDQPMPAFPYTADYLAGLMVTSSVLAAVYNAQKTGVGESIDAAMYEVLLLVGQYYMINYFNGGKLCPRMTKGKDPIWVGCGLYKCKDAYLVMEIVGARQIEDMLEILGLKHLIGTVGMPKGAQLIPRECPSGELVEDKLDAYMADRPVEEVLKTLAELRVAAAKVLTVPELESNPQYVARDSFIEWDTMAGRKFKGPNIVPKFKKHPGQVWRAMPSQGMDTAGILAELGYSEADIRALAEKKIVKLGTAPERS